MAKSMSRRAALTKAALLLEPAAKPMLPTNDNRTGHVKSLDKRAKPVARAKVMQGLEKILMAHHIIRLAPIEKHHSRPLLGMFKGVDNRPY